MEDEIKEMQVHEFVRRFKSLIKSNAKFCFFLGAGCSVTSGVKAAGSLVEEWLPKLKELEVGDSENFDKWLGRRYPNYEKDNAANYYGQIIEDLFPSPKERQKEIERQLEDAYPGFGYAVLAKLIDEYGIYCNIIITTNFDDMVADALYLYTNKKPIVIFHDSLANFVRISDTRPYVIQLHGDSKLSPRNTKDETDELGNEVQNVIENLFSETGLIFIGYGGNDNSVNKFFNGLSKDKVLFPLGIYWVGKSITNNNMRKFLKDRKAIRVDHKNFDELMLYILEEFEIEPIFDTKLENVSSKVYNTLKSFKEENSAKPNSEEKELLKTAAGKVDVGFSGLMIPDYSEIFRNLANISASSEIFRNLTKTPYHSEFFKNIINVPNCSELFRNLGFVNRVKYGLLDEKSEQDKDSLLDEKSEQEKDSLLDEKSEQEKDSLLDEKSEQEKE